MATLIPSLAHCVFEHAGERLVAERLDQTLGPRVLVWHQAPVGPRQMQVSFVVLCPHRGLLMLEVRDWTVEQIERATPQAFVLAQEEVSTLLINPQAQARHCAIQTAAALVRDARLRPADDAEPLQLDFSWGHGVVLTGITRRQFNEAGLDQSIEPRFVICQDELTPKGDAPQLEQRLWNMLTHLSKGGVSPERLDRIRWNIFPQVRLPLRGQWFALRDPLADLPDAMPVLNLHQERVLRAPLHGHHIVQGTAGTGKTLLLAARAQQLARATAVSSRPILVLCASEPLSVTLREDVEAQGLGNNIQVRYFQNWCYRQLNSYGQALPAQSQAAPDALVQRVIRAVNARRIPKAQYQAIFIDEGHDFAPEWLTLISQMVDPGTQRLMLAFDPSQTPSGVLELQSTGMQAQGEPFLVATPYRHAKPPMLIDAPSAREETVAIAQHLNQVHERGLAWGRMALLCADAASLNLCAHTLATLKLPYRVRKKPGDYQPGADCIQVMTIAASKGLEFDLVAIPGVGQWPAVGQGHDSALRELHVAMARATESVVIGVAGGCALATALRQNTLTEGQAPAASPD